MMQPEVNPTIGAQEPPPLVSIIVPAYRAEKFLPATLESVALQTFKNWELIVVDDGSPDDTYAVARQYAEKLPRIQAFTQSNGGPAAARNAGYRHSNPAAPYVAFLDGDDCWEPRALEDLKNALEAVPDACGVHALARLIDVEGRLLPDDYNIARCRERKRFDWGASAPGAEGQITNFEMLVVENPILTPGVVLLRRAAIEASGLFDPELFGTEDWEIWTRLSRVRPFVFLNQVVLNYRKHPQSVSQKGRSMNRNEMVARKKIINSPQNTPAQRELARRGARFFYRQVAQGQFQSAKRSLRQGQLLPALRLLRHSLLMRYQVAALLG